MEPILLIVTLILLVMQFALPHRLAFLPLLIASCHLGNVEVLGDFTPVRALIVAGVARAMSTGTFQFSWSHPLDRLFAILAVIILVSSIGHQESLYNPYVERIGLALNILGSYLYARAFVSTPEEYRSMLMAFAIVLTPLSVCLAAEQVSGKNLYHALGAPGATAGTRNGEFRAQGPFNHSILSGTVGATALPLFAIFWRQKRTLAVVAMGACLVGVIASGSSGPLVATMASLGFLLFWRWRHLTRTVRLTVIACLVVLNFVMARPIWFLIARIDLVGGSTGWHRSKLIDSAMTHLNEWWLFGTDYTRHWMLTGVSWNPNHTDLTNYYIHLGVLGGLPLLICFILVLRKCFRLLGEKMEELSEEESEGEFVLWTVGVALVAHAVSFISISYFGQMYALFYLLIGVIPGLLEAEAEEFEEVFEEEVMYGEEPLLS